MNLTIEQFIRKAKEEAGALAKILDEGDRIDLSSPEACGQLAALNNIYLSRAKELKDFLGNALTELPDGRSISTPELIALRELARDSGKTMEEVLEKTSIKGSRVVQLPLQLFPAKDLKYCAAFGHLKALWLAGAEVEDLRPISKLTGLEDLWLGKTSVRDLGPIANLRTLKVLDVSSTLVEDINPIAGLKMLHDLRLRGLRIDDLSVLRNLSSLSVVILPEFPQTRENLSIVSELRARKMTVI